MATNIGDLVRDVQILGDTVRERTKDLEYAENRLLKALAKTGNSITPYGMVMVGGVRVYKPIGSRIEFADVAIVDPETAVTV